MDKPYDAKSDLWSLGCVIYEIAALVPPFRAKDMPGLYSKVTKGTYPALPIKYSLELNKVIAMMLTVDPKKRPSIDELMKLP